MRAVLGRFDKREFSLILALIVFAVMALLFTYLVLPRAKIFRDVSTTEVTLKKVVENGDLLDTQLAQIQGDID